MASSDTRLTRGDVHERVKKIAKTYKVEIAVNFYSPAGRSLGRITDNDSNNLSDRLTLSEITLWLDGYEAAMKQAKTDIQALLKATAIIANGRSHPDYDAATVIVGDYILKNE